MEKQVFSKYNLFKIYDDNVVVGVNLLEKKMFALEKKKYDNLISQQNNLAELKRDRPSFFSVMYKFGVIRNSKFDNSVGEIMMLQNRKETFFSESYVLTILPTLNCNFNCWYCYELNRPKHYMSQNTIESVIKHIDKVVPNKTVFNLDWYGGEPLLCFDNIIKPISEKAKKACEQNAVKLKTGITTNGYLLNENMLQLFKDCNFQIFQITLNGPKHIHDTVRFQKGTTDSYERIVNNIIMIAKELTPETLILRINFSMDYFDSITEIIESFPIEIRNKINILPKQLDQEKFNNAVKYEDYLTKLSLFEKAGFKVDKLTSFLTDRKYACMANLYNQALINYDGRVFKCHNLNFEKEKEEGILKGDGTIKWKEEVISKIINKNPLSNKKCQCCKFIPVCSGLCSYRPHYLKNLERCPLADDLKKDLYRKMDIFKIKLRV
jgi:uncharacterized protein